MHRGSAPPPAVAARIRIPTCRDASSGSRRRARPPGGPTARRRAETREGTRWLDPRPCREWRVPNPPRGSTASGARRDRGGWEVVERRRIDPRARVPLDVAEFEYLGRSDERHRDSGAAGTCRSPDAVKVLIRRQRDVVVDDVGDVVDIEGSRRQRGCDENADEVGWY